MEATERLWRTSDGRLVRDGDADAATLAYTPGDRVASRDESLVPGDTGEASDVEEKAAPKPADKSRRPSGNKSRG